MDLSPSLAGAARAACDRSEKSSEESGGNSEPSDQKFVSLLLAWSAGTVIVHNGRLFAPVKRKHQMTKTMRVLLALTAVALMVAAFGGTAKADTQSLVVNDPSFENLGNPDGSPQDATDVPTQTGYYPDNDPSNTWVSGNDFYNNAYSSGKWAQVNGDDAAVEWRPTSGQFSVPLPDGAQVLASSSNSTWPTPAWGGRISVLQTLYQANPVLGLLQADATYTVTADIGKVIGSGKFERRQHRLR